MAEYVSMIGDSFVNSDDCLKVVLRIRPPESDEVNNVNHFQVIDGQRLNVKIPRDSWTYKNLKRLNNENNHGFEFSNIYDWNATQSKLFDGIIDYVILDFLSGRNSLLFTYGITNSGKTHTLIGKPSDPGILPRAIDYIFTCLNRYDIGMVPTFCDVPYKGIIESENDELKRLNQIKDYLLNGYMNDIISNQNFTFSVEHNDSFYFNKDDEPSFDHINIGIDVMDLPESSNTVYYLYISIAEIYNEQIYDLLDTSFAESGREFRRSALKIHGSIKSGFYVKNLRSVLVCNQLEAFKLLQVGLSNRSMAATRMNINSSRSHVLYTLKLVRATKLPNGMVASKVNQMCFVDLAGAERQATTLSEGDRLKEASNINKSLLFLNRCIQDMRDYRLKIHRPHAVSYRECRLTHLLQPYFVGRSRTVLLVNISPSIKLFDDTFAVLKFSTTTREALNRPVGFELDQAVRADAVVYDSQSINLLEFDRAQLIDIICSLRRKLLDQTKNNESHSSVVREEMSQFTMDLMSEIEEEHERQLHQQRQIISDSFMVKIEILTAEIHHLRQLQNDTIADKQFNEEKSKLEFMLYEEQNKIKELLQDIDSYKTDKIKELNSIQDNCDNLKSALNNKNDLIIELQSDKTRLENKCTELLQLETQLENALNNICKKDIEIKNLQKSLKLMQTNENDLHQKNQLLFDKFNNISRIITKLDIIQPSSKNNDIVDILKEQIETFIIKYKAIEDDCNELKCQLQTRQKMSAAASSDIRELSRSLANLKVAMESLSNYVVVMNSSLKIDTSRLLLKFNDIKLKYEIHLREVLESKNLIRQLKDQDQCSQSSYARLTETLSEAQKEIEQLKEKVSDLQSTITTLQTENQNLIIKSNKIESDLIISKGNLTLDYQTNPEIVRLEQELKGWKRLHDEDLAQISKLENIITERQLMSARRQSKAIEPLKRNATTAAIQNENYPCVYSKKKYK